VLAASGAAEKEKKYECQRQPRGRPGRVAGWMHFACCLLHDFEARFFDDRIGENFFRDALDLLRGFVARQTFDIQDEEFALAHIFDGGVAQTGERVLNGLSLRIEYRAFWHHPNVCFHAVSITFAAEGESLREREAKS